MTDGVVDGLAATLVDPSDPAFVADPYPAFARLRAAGELHRHPSLGQGGRPIVVAVSHRACSALLRHRGLGRVWRDRGSPAVDLLHRTSLLEMEDPRHARLRGLVAGAFARGHVERLGPWVARTAEDLVDGLAARIRDDGSADLVAEVAEPLPVRVICALLGVPQEDAPLLTGWSHAIVKLYEASPGPGRERAAEDAAAAFTAYLRDLAAQRRARPADDLVSDLVRAEGLTEDELVGTAVLLLMAGHEASVNLVANGVSALLRHREQWERLADPVPAIEELVRYDSPLQLFERTALADTELLGVPLRAGDKVAALLGAAGRDPALVADPDVLDVRRPAAPHLGFGAGVHYCLGAPLARAEAAAVLGALRRRLPGLHPAGPAERRPEFVIRGFTRVVVSA